MSARLRRRLDALMPLAPVVSDIEKAAALRAELAEIDARTVRANEITAALAALEEAGVAGEASLKLGRVLAILLAPVLFGMAAGAAPPPGADPESAVGRWVRSLRSPLGLSCCDEADCRRVEMRVGVAGGIEVFIDERFPGGPGAWFPVPEPVVEGTRSNGPPPDASSWACFYGGRVQCFVMGGGF